MKRTPSAAFTLIELLVVISIIAILAALAVPALTNALTKGQMTGTMNNARQLYLAGFQMATDGTTNSDPNFAWPGDYGTSGTTGVTTLQAYCSKLTQNEYLQPGDLQKILSAPGATCTVNADATTKAVTLDGKSALKVYRISSGDAANAIFAATANFTYDTAPTATGVPYGDKGFVIMRKGGDAGVYKKNQATKANHDGDIDKYKNAMGVLPGGATSENSGMVLTNPGGTGSGTGTGAP